MRLTTRAAGTPAQAPVHSEPVAPRTPGHGRKMVGGAFLAALALTMLVGGTASASTLVRTAVDGAEWGPRALHPLAAIAVTAELSDTQMISTETRSPAWVGSDSFGSSSWEMVMHRSLLQPGTVVQGVQVDGMPHGWTMLDADEADAYRMALALELRDGAPLDELGTRLVVLEPIAREAWDAVPVVTLEMTQPLSAHGTLRGATIPMDWHKQPIGSVSVEVSAQTEAPLRALYSPYHTLSVVTDGAHGAMASYHGSARCTAFDLSILLSTGTEPFHLDLLPYRTGAGDSGSLLALLTPSADAGDNVVPRDLVVVVDTSGSMEGGKIQQARAAMASILEGLRPQDRLAMVTFSDEAQGFSDHAVMASPDQIAQALGFVGDIVAEGGTNIHAALDTAFQALPPSEGHPRYVVLLTDGVPTAGVTDIDEILALARARNEVGARIFAFGLGNDVNTVLLDTLAMDSAGDALYIAPGQSVEAAVAAFFAQVADPLLADPVLDMADLGVEDMQPAVLQDLFAGQTATIAARYTQSGPVTIVLQGHRNGALEHHVFEVTMPEVATTEPYVPRVWATRKVGALLQEVKLGDTSDALVADVLALADRFGVVTEFTFFAVDEDGNAAMTYSPVPVAAVGAVAVSTSSSLDTYQKGGTVGEAVDTWIRYVWDRTFPKQLGWFTDTSLDSGEEWTDLRFGSEAWQALALAERHLGIGSFLAVDPSVRFEHYGRRFRVTADDDPIGDLIEEDAIIPAPAEWPAEVPCSVAYTGLVGSDVGHGPDGVPTPKEHPDDSTAATGDLGSPGGSGSGALDAGASAGCAGAGQPGGPPPALPVVAVLALGMLVGTRRRGADQR